MIEMKIGDRYNWKNQPERLIYLGDNFSGNGYWHQFALVDKPDVVWCEVKGFELEHFEETKSVSVIPVDVVKIVRDEFEEPKSYCYDYSPYQETGKKKAQWKQETRGRH